MDYDNMEVSYKGNNLRFAQKEFMLLYKLLSVPNKLYKREDLMEEIWGLDSESDYRTVDVHIKRIRKKLMDAGVKEFEIVTVRGFRI